MNEPNHQDQPENKQTSSRANSFLMMGSSTVGQISQTSPLNSGTAHSEETQYDYSQQEYQNTDYPQNEYEQPPAQQHYESHTPSPQKKTGVISSTIHPARRPGNTEEQDPTPRQSAAKTTHLSHETTGVPETRKEKTDLTEVLADKITDVLKKANDFKTGVLDPDKKMSEKVALMAKKSEFFSKFLAFMLKQLSPIVKLIQRINQKLIDKNVVQPKAPPPPPEEETQTQNYETPPEKVSFLELAEKNIIFCDNRKRPLYTLEQMRGKSGYTASEEVLAPMIYETIIEAFKEVAPKARAIPTPTEGYYANLPMEQVMEHINIEEIQRFLNYVQKFPRGYVGKSFRITESFAGWVVSGTPND